jgi:hypothetical protein
MSASKSIHLVSGDRRHRLYTWRLVTLLPRLSTTVEATMATVTIIRTGVMIEATTDAVK